MPSASTRRACISEEAWIVEPYCMVKEAFCVEPGTVITLELLPRL